MSLITERGFFSYAHGDNKNNCLKHLRDDLCHEYETLRSERLDLFFDRESIGWGSRWEEAISADIGRASFFIPVLSPRYFTSEYCTKELVQYLTYCEMINARELVFPILYVDITADYLNLQNELVEKALAYQYVDWRDLRFKSRRSKHYKRMINTMALEIIKKQNAISERIASSCVIDASQDNQRVVVNEDEEAPVFFLEAINNITTTAPKLEGALESITNSISDIGGIVNEGADEIDKANARGQGAQAIAPITAKMASKLDEPVTLYEKEAKQCAELIEAMDAPVRSIIHANITLGNDDTNANALFSIQDLSSNALKTKGQIDDFANTVGALKTISRTLYAPFRKIEKATRICSSAFDIVIAWARLIDENEIV